MKTIEQIVKAISNKETWERGSCEILDQRDLNRILDFLSPDQVKIALGDTLKKDADLSNWKVIPLTEEVVKERLAKDLDFAFEKAINHRGISSSLMHEVILMWMWILDDELVNFKQYNPYGMLLYEQVANKYNLPNRGNEYLDNE